MEIRFPLKLESNRTRPFVVVVVVVVVAPPSSGFKQNKQDSSWCVVDLVFFILL